MGFPKFGRYMCIWNPDGIGSSWKYHSPFAWVKSRQAARGGEFRVFKNLYIIQLLGTCVAQKMKIFLENKRRLILFEMLRSRGRNACLAYPNEYRKFRTKSTLRILEKFSFGWKKSGWNRMAKRKIGSEDFEVGT